MSHIWRTAMPHQKTETEQRRSEELSDYCEHNRRTRKQCRRRQCTGIIGKIQQNQHHGVADRIKGIPHAEHTEISVHHIAES